MFIIYYFTCLLKSENINIMALNAVRKCSKNQLKVCFIRVSSVDKLTNKMCSPEQPARLQIQLES